MEFNVIETNEIIFQKIVCNQICGCIVTVYHNGKARIMMVDNVETKESYRLHGFATELMKKIICLAKEYEVDSIELVVNNDNDAAKGLYKKVGFEKTNKEYYRLILNKL